MYYSKSLKAVIAPDNQQKVLQFIRTRLSEYKADNIAIEDNHISYKGSTSMWNTALMRGVDNGTFTLVNKNDQWFLEYRINMYKLFTATSIMSIVIGIYCQINLQRWWMGIFAFLWLCGGNWVINVLRHGSLVPEIAAGIDALIGYEENVVEGEPRDESLKSWF